jgi:putative Ca2+/H+ antiporter (TMEM165/GDT1 family)
MEAALFLTTFIVVGLAELGDKTQLLTIALATRYPPLTVILGVSAATAILMLIAVAAGQFVYHLIPLRAVYLFAGCFFILFGIWIILQEEGEEKEREVQAHPFVAVFSAFLLAEFGDKTQLATIPLAAATPAPFWVWAGATLGMVTVNSLGIFFGRLLEQKLPENYVKKIAAALFALFGWIFLLKFIYA